MSCIAAAVHWRSKRARQPGGDAVEEIQSHYNAVTDAWQQIMGDNLHFGYFPSEDTPLSVATDHLIDRMAGLADITPGTKVLDVGCGIGNPALYLHRRYGCSIVGISTSDKGVDLANEASKREARFPMVRFQVADGTNNGLPDESFDLVWVMESSHLMKQKNLMKECFRVLKTGGKVLLCDLMASDQRSQRHLSVMMQNLAKFKIVQNAFGKSRVMAQKSYRVAMEEAGFGEIRSVDISGGVRPTMKHWKSNAVRYKQTLSGDMPVAKVDEFIDACDTLELFYSEEILTYTILEAVKN